MKNIILYLIFRYGFPNLPPPPLTWTPPFIRFSENFPHPYYLDPPVYQAPKTKEKPFKVPFIFHQVRGYITMKGHIQLINEDTIFKLEEILSYNMQIVFKKM